MPAGVGVGEEDMLGLRSDGVGVGQGAREELGDVENPEPCDGIRDAGVGARDYRRGYVIQEFRAMLVRVTAVVKRNQR